jgi:hypothetical protein
MQVLESSDGPLMYQLKHLGAAECHFAYRMVVVMMRRDMPMPKVRSCCTHSRRLTNSCCTSRQYAGVWYYQTIGES